MLRTGHAEGALARWRTLHELVVVATFLSDHDADHARRYLEHESIILWWDMAPYQQHAKRLGLEPYTQAELDEVSAERDRLLAKHGKRFDDPWGWLVGVVAKPTFAALEEATKLDHWRPLYREANAAVHGGSARLSNRLGVDDALVTLLTGPSNLGLDAPGSDTALSLSMITATTLLHRANMDSLVSARVVIELADDARRAFEAGGKRLAELVAADAKADARRRRRRERYQERRAAQRT